LISCKTNLKFFRFDKIEKKAQGTCCNPLSYTHEKDALTQEFISILEK